MAALTPAAAIDALVAIGFSAVAAWSGYKRRRRFWSRGSWLRFGATLLIGFALLGFTFYFSADPGRPWSGAPGSNRRAAWAIATAACLIAGTLIVTFTLMWFARGRPRRPFSFPWLIRSGRRIISSKDNILLADAYDEDIAETPEPELIVSRKK
jgi:hypothetical protein